MKHASILMTGLKNGIAAIHGPKAHATALNWRAPSTPMSFVSMVYFVPGFVLFIACSIGSSKEYEPSQLPNRRTIASSRPLHNLLYFGVTILYLILTTSAM